MKKFLIIVLLVGVSFGENLTFINSKDTIVFEYKDLININQERFRFLNKDEDIINLTKEYIFKSMESKSDIKNDYKFFSAILAAGSNGLFGASLGYFYGGIYGFLSYGEGDMNFVENGNWKIQ